MANANDTRDTPAPANKIEQIVARYETAPSGAPPIPWTPARRVVLTEDGQPTALRCLTMEEAQAEAEAAAKAAAEAQAAQEAKDRKAQQKLKRLFPRKPTAPRSKAAPKHADRILKVAPLPGNFNHTPWIRLAGQWLAQAGFALDSRVRVQVEQGRLIITPEDAPA
jgi:Toxin SymE, type I toxin-antitoxin system